MFLETHVLAIPTPDAADRAGSTKSPAHNKRPSLAPAKSTGGYSSHSPRTSSSISSTANSNYRPSVTSNGHASVRPSLSPTREGSVQSRKFRPSATVSNDSSFSYSDTAAIAADTVTMGVQPRGSVTPEESVTAGVTAGATESVTDTAADVTELQRIFLHLDADHRLERHISSYI